MALTVTGMAAAIEAALGVEWQTAKNEPLPGAGQADRQLLFRAISRGVLQYLENNQGQIFTSLTLQSGGVTRTYTVTNANFNF
jgi:hypothetical protein